mmetsp:Transcript_18401/g.39792  ORF Transcript_18401/g.39792 Transcript_18401/m.39792 type:complete len:782 (-) Transcript_18401:73-2418(-)|eukprot:CAMPEP_0172325398 /NCGR_PEP_ID=MMETSP1058-20130122/53937_1 /TAXON_ID=83371 /ORGANISM="Detonula confervacea, Strain CCMP 353" /LENGTH=781 /DNA_ID=CAMNT_0013041935 /DNA_START=39 /DNA_END=2384 /DNA_ORIENTATION=-
MMDAAINNQGRRRRRGRFHSAAASAMAVSVVCYLLISTTNAAAASSSSTTTETKVRVLRGARSRQTQSSEESSSNKLFQERKAGKNVEERANADGKENKNKTKVDPSKLDRAALYNKCKKPKSGKVPLVAPATAPAVDGTTATEIETDTICDEDGNLLPGEISYAPTITPSDDETTTGGTTDGNDDTDNDGLTNGQEDVTDELSMADSDHDSLTNGQEALLGTDPNNSDSDSDGLSDGQEVHLGTDPLNPDSDGDGHDDYQESVVDGSDPLDATDFVTPDVIDAESVADNDADGLTNAEELEIYGTDANNPDSDGDGLTDGMEVNIQGTDPLNVDTDGDGLSDYDEVMIHGTNPLNADHDNDGLNDAFEVENGLDPLTSNTGMGDALAISPGCDAWMNGEVYTTTIPATVNFLYEVAIDDAAGVSVSEVNDGMEQNMAKLVGRELIKCELLRRLGVSHVVASSNQHQHHQRHLLVDGVDSMPQDIITQKTCTYYTGDNPETPTNSNCHVIQGFMTLYLRENSVLSSTLTSSSRALKALLTAMNRDDPSPFVEFSGDEEFSVSGVKGVRYIKGTPDEGGILLIDNSGNGGVGTGDGVGSAKGGNNDATSDTDTLSPVGIALIAIGAAGILAVALVAARNKRKQSDSPYAEFYDDENDMDLKHHGLDAMTDVDASSLDDGAPSPRKSRQAWYEEEDSIFSGLDAPRAESENDPKFVHTHDDLGSIAMTAEQGYEFGYSEDPFPRHEYEPKVQLESPRYENPAGMRQSPERNGRSSFVGDTVEF